MGCHGSVPDVVGEEWLTLSANWGQVVIINKLLVGKHPVAETEQEEGRELQVCQDRVVKFLIVSWWLFEHVVKHELL